MADEYYLLLYDYVEDILERRAPYREQHLAKIREGHEAGQISLAGPLGDPPVGAAIVFRGVDRAAVEEFAMTDPYVQAGLVPSRRIELWKQV